MTPLRLLALRTPLRLLTIRNLVFEVRGLGFREVLGLGFRVTGRADLASPQAE